MRRSETTMEECLGLSKRSFLMTEARITIIDDEHPGRRLDVSCLVRTSKPASEAERLALVLCRNNLLYLATVSYSP